MTKNREQRGNEEAGPYRRLTAHPTPSTRLAHVCHSLRRSAASRDEWREPKGTVTRRREAGEWRVTDVERGPSHYVHPAPLTSLSLRSRTVREENVENGP